jgi:ankyrin repeat protein
VALEEAYETGDDDEIKALESLCRLLSPYWPIEKRMIQHFHTSCRKNDLSMTKLFLEIIQMDPNVQGQSGMTALHFAARSGCTDVIQYLLSQEGIDVDLKDKFDNTRQDAARVNHQTEALALLEDFIAN